MLAIDAKVVVRHLAGEHPVPSRVAEARGAVASFDRRFAKRAAAMSDVDVRAL